MNSHDNQAMQALSNAGAVCGNCGDEPGDRTCLNCERCYQQYVTALRAAGWAPRSEVLGEAAREIEAAQDRIDADEVAEHGSLDHRGELRGEAVRFMAKLLRVRSSEAATVRPATP